MANISAELRAWRSERGLTAPAAAASLGVSFHTFRGWERGDSCGAAGPVNRLMAVLPESVPPPVFAERLRSWRDILGLTVLASAERAGVSERAWSGWESGGACDAWKPVLSHLRVVMAEIRAERAASGTAPAAPISGAPRLALPDLGPSIPMGGVPETGD